MSTKDTSLFSNQSKPFISLLCCFFLLFFSHISHSSNTWTVVGDLTTPRANHSATTMPNDTVLVSGGRSNDVVVRSAEVFHPQTYEWKPIKNMNQARENHVSVLLDDGRVLIAGGKGAGNELSSAEIYNPATDDWTSVTSMATPRTNSLSTKLLDGRILVSGGTSAGNALLGAEIYDPSRDTWTTTGQMDADTSHTNTAILLNDGRVFIRGHAGYTNSQFVDIQPGDPYYPQESPTKLPQVFDPDSNAWHSVSPMNTPKLGGTAVKLSDGRVLAVGGERFGGDSWGYPIFYCDTPGEIYDPISDTWTSVNSLNSPGLNPSKAVLLPSGNVLAFGPSTRTNFYSACGTDGGKTDLLDINALTWEATDTASTRHDYGGAYTALSDGKVLTIGAGTFQEIVEIYTPSGIAPEPPQRSEFSFIADIDGAGVENNNYPVFTWQATTIFTVHDENNQPIQDAEILSKSYSSQNTPYTCSTNASGTCSIVTTTSNDSHNVTVIDIRKSLIAYDPTLNTDPDGDSDGTSISIQRPGTIEPWMYVSDIDGSSEKIRKRRWQATVEIQITNWNGDPENYVEVFGEWGGGISEAASCIPRSNGTCSITSERIRTSKSSVTFTVTNAISNWFVYDSSLNNDVDGNSDGTKITIYKP